MDAVGGVHRPQARLHAGSDLPVGGLELRPELVTLRRRGPLVAEHRRSLLALALQGRGNDVVGGRAAERDQAKLRLLPGQAIVGLGIAEPTRAFVGQATFEQRVVPHTKAAVGLAQDGVVAADAERFPRPVGAQHRLRVLDGRIHAQVHAVDRGEESLVNE